MIKRLLLLGWICMSIESKAQLIPEWHTNGLIPAFDKKTLVEMPSGNILMVRKDSYFGLGSGIDAIQCYNPQGQLIWQYEDTDISDQVALNILDVAVDADNNIYLACDNFPLTASYPKPHIVKFNASGTMLFNINISQQSDWYEKISQIEITSDGRIFALATLYNSTVQTLSPNFIEFNSEGEVINALPDNNYVLGDEHLQDFGDGFLYCFNDQNVVKLDYDGNIIWNMTPNYGEGLIPSFPYDGSQPLVIQQGGQILMCQSIYNSNTGEQSLGFLSMDEEGNQIVADVINLFEDMSNMWSVAPYFLSVDISNNKYISGQYSYTDQGPQVDGEDDNRGKGSSFVGTFVMRLNSNNEVVWMNTYLEDDPLGPHYPQFQFMNGTYPCVIFSAGFFDSEMQLTVSYNIENGTELWSHQEISNSAFDSSNPDSGLLSSDGFVYTTGTGMNLIEGGSEYSVFLYKYAILDAGMEQVNESGNIHIWPNPSKGDLNVVTIGNADDLIIYNITGQVVLRQRMSGGSTSLDLHDLPSGVYWIARSGSPMERTKWMKL